MPAKSRSQLRYMYAVASGKVKSKSLTKAQAQEFIDKTKNVKKLPNKASKKHK